MTKTKKRRANVAANARHDISAEAEYQKYSWYAGLLLGLTFGIILFLGW